MRRRASNGDGCTASMSYYRFDSAEDYEKQEERQRRGWKRRRRRSCWNRRRRGRGIAQNGGGKEGLEGDEEKGIRCGGRAGEDYKERDGGVEDEEDLRGDVMAPARIAQSNAMNSMFLQCIYAHIIIYIHIARYLHIRKHTRALTHAHSRTHMHACSICRAY